MYIKVKAFPSSKKEFFEKNSEDTYTVYVRDRAERNLANKRIVEVIAEQLGVPRGKIRIVSGHHSQGKILSVDIN